MQWPGRQIHGKFIDREPSLGSEYEPSPGRDIHNHQAITWTVGVEKFRTLGRQHPRVQRSIRHVRGGRPAEGSQDP